jgi:peptidyl-prolyl cis-trans isomerase A (cyclophilin A)
VLRPTAARAIPGKERTMSITRRILLAGLAAAALGTASRGFAQNKKPVVLLDTSMGQIQIELNPDKAPISVKNFIGYVEAKHYDGLVFHRVIPGFMIQGGGMTPDLQPRKTKAPIKNEASNGLKNERGTIAMARTSDPDSATSQFFINVVDNKSLDRPNPDGHGYAVFGKVTKGMDVVDKIVAVETGSRGPYSDVPVKPVVIKTAKMQ